MNIPNGLVTGDNLRRLVMEGVIAAPMEQVGPSSVDVTIGDDILIERIQHSGPLVLGDSSEDVFAAYRLQDVPLIRPGAFLLGSINEELNLPNNISAQFHLRSSVARSGIEHLMAGWIDPGFSGDLTLELTNALTFKSIIIPPNFRIGQITFFAHDPVPEEMSYRLIGRYNGQRGPTPAVKRVL